MEQNDTLLKELDYESRNLGIKAFALSEFAISNWNLALLQNKTKALEIQHGKFFIQAKLSQSNFHLSRQLQALGFCYIETTITPHALFSKNQALQQFIKNKELFLPKKFSIKDISTETISRENISAINEIKSIALESFTKDRFHLDNVCPDEIANIRYKNWLNDMEQDPAYCFDTITIKNEMAGFLARKEEHLVLAGFSRKFSSSGLGDFLWLFSLNKMAKEGFKMAHTQISANNLAVLNLYMRLGFKIKDTSTLFHYWSNEAIDHYKNHTNL